MNWTSILYFLLIYHFVTTTWWISCINWTCCCFETNIIAMLKHEWVDNACGYTKPDFRRIFGGFLWADVTWLHPTLPWKTLLSELKAPFETWKTNCFNKSHLEDVQRFQHACGVQLWCSKKQKYDFRTATFGNQLGQFFILTTIPNKKHTWNSSKMPAFFANKISPNTKSAWNLSLDRSTGRKTLRVTG